MGPHSYDPLPTGDQHDTTEAYAGMGGPVHLPSANAHPYQQRAGYGLSPHTPRATRPPRYDINDSMRDMYGDGSLYRSAVVRSTLSSDGSTTVSI